MLPIFEFEESLGIIAGYMVLGQATLLGISSSDAFSLFGTRKFPFFREPVTSFLFLVVLLHTINCSGVCFRLIEVCLLFR